MPFQPDIIVTGPDGVTLVVEAKASLPDFEQTEQQLRRYMIGMQCPAGMLITPERMWLYRDLYASPPDVELVAEFDTQGVWPQPPPKDAALFELFVQQWPEGLAQQRPDGKTRLRRARFVVFLSREGCWTNQTSQRNCQRSRSALGFQQPKACLRIQR
jgi:hypothetical protein